ncbi:MAG: ATP-dependent helicase HrpB, partial [Planctomycetales bacterium]|nr:ATP-dependent helicase HrpB [Planctomycetales bacterium]
MPETRLPIDDCLPQVLSALRENNCVALRAPTGAGKTTRVPPAMLDAGWAGGGQIVVLQPRRLAARACARRIANERGGRLGDEVGYQVRFERCRSPQTKIVVVTEGILLRMLARDPFLESVAAIVFDEFHERSLQSDLALAMARRVQQSVRTDLRLVVMSATLDPTPIASFLGGCPVVESRGRTFPVDVQYLEIGANRSLAERATEGVAWILDRTEGDILVFLPGAREIRQAAAALRSLAAAHDLHVAPLYGDLSPEQQDAALARGRRRKVVLATNVAETSLTIEGVTGVVDTGVARILSFDPHVGIDRLALQPVSQASADQRAGRAGRTQPGVCLRLWPERTHRQRVEFNQAEIERLDLSGSVLQLRAWGESNLRAFPWFQAPPEVSLEHADTLLQRLGALDDEYRVTEVGGAMSQLPASPRLARMLLEGHRLGRPEPVALAVSLLLERSPFGRGEQRITRHRSASGVVESDILDRIAALEAFESQGDVVSSVGSLHRGAAKQLLRVRDQLVRMVADFAADGPWEATPVDGDEAVLRALLAGFPDRLVRRSKPGSRFGRMVGGRGVRLSDQSAVREANLYLAVDVDAGEAEAMVRQASAIEREWLAEEQLTRRVEVEFDNVEQKVVARRRTYWADVLLDETPAALPDEEQVAAILVQQASQCLDDVFPDDD